VTMRRPEGFNLWQWAIEGVSLKTVFVVIGMMVTSHYAMQTRVTLVEQQQPEMNRRFDEMTKQLDEQRDALKAKVDQETYDRDQRKLSEQLGSIQASVGNIETILMEKKTGR
jgi:uncharacterized protein YlxW (UPF0749 family)